MIRNNTSGWPMFAYEYMRMTGQILFGPSKALLVVLFEDIGEVRMARW